MTAELIGDSTEILIRLGVSKCEVSNYLSMRTIKPSFYEEVNFFCSLILFVLYCSCYLFIFVFTYNILCTFAHFLSLSHSFSLSSTFQLCRQRSVRLKLQGCQTSTTARTMSSTFSLGRVVPLLDGSPGRILVVDDSELCRKTICGLIKRLCPDVIVELDEADDGLSAIELVQSSFEEERPYSMILIDNTMTKMHGPQAVQQIRAIGFEGFIFGVTGNVFQSDIAEFLQSGADEVLSKPLHKDLMIGLLNICRTDFSKT